jgi:TatD DNase family protein
VPVGRLLLETDAPYLAPVPLRGKRNEPSYLPHTAQVVAREAGLGVAELVAAAALATRKLFHLAGA